MFLIRVLKAECRAFDLLLRNPFSAMFHLENRFLVCVSPWLLKIHAFNLKCQEVAYLFSLIDLLSDARGVQNMSSQYF